MAAISGARWVGHYACTTPLYDSEFAGMSLTNDAKSIQTITHDSRLCNMKCNQLINPLTCGAADVVLLDPAATVDSASSTYIAV